MLKLQQKWYTYRHGQLDTDRGTHKAQDGASKGNAKPKTSCRHSTGKVVLLANLAHEGHDPASEGNFNADIAEQKERRDPRDARGWLFEQSFAEASLFLGLRLLGLSVCGAVDGPGGLPERCRQGDQFDPSDANLTSQQSPVLQCI